MTGRVSPRQYTHGHAAVQNPRCERVASRQYCQASRTRRGLGLGKAPAENRSFSTIRGTCSSPAVLSSIPLCALTLSDPARVRWCSLSRTILYRRPAVPKSPILLSPRIPPSGRGSAPPRRELARPLKARCRGQKAGSARPSGKVAADVIILLDR